MKKNALDESAARVRRSFRRLFREEPLLVRSPGRVNFIGEHTDYNEGFVLPAAVDKAVYFALGRATEPEGFLQAEDLKASFVFHPDRIERTNFGWPNYLLGVVLEIRKTGRSVPGFRCVFGGDIPSGAGLSSSAALEAGLAFGLNRLFGLGLSPLELVRTAQRAENTFVGVRCGVMDPFVNIFARPRTVLKLDCRSLEYAHLPFERDDLRVVLCDTKVKRALASSEYNVRRAQCEEGVRVLQRHAAGVRSLRDATPEMLEACRGEMDAVVYRRCAFVLRENERVERACGDLERGDFASFGRRMDASHDGLRDEYEVSCRELDILVESARRAPGVLGARMMGAGFGGCTITLVEVGAVEEFRSRVREEYASRTGHEPEFHVALLSAGTEVVRCSP